jgi:RND family efflux transporter MFP subunit
MKTFIHYRTQRLAAAVACCLLAFIGCGKEAPPAPEPSVRAVRLFEVGSQDLLEQREYPGHITAATEAQVSFEVSGRILELPVSQGQRVREGDLLARIDPSDYQAQLDASIAQRDAALADYERFEELLAKDAVSQRDFESRKRNWEVAEANLRIVEKNLADTSLRAPFAGRVARKYVERFQNVQAKEPVLLLQDDLHLEIDVSLPEAALLRIGRSIDLRTLNSLLKPVVAISSLPPDTTFPARLQELATAADPTTRTFEATFAFDSPSEVLILPGMTALVRMSATIDELGATVAIPASSTVIDASGASSVWRVDRDTMEVHRVAVELGELSGVSVAVERGLERGDLIAASGANQLREGMRVRSSETP